MEEDNIRMMKRIAIASAFYQNDIISKQLLSDEFTSLDVFLKGYAYERNVPVPQYSELASLTLKKLYNGKITTIEENDQKSAWAIYEKLAKKNYPELGLNSSHNPMFTDNGVLMIMREQEIVNLPSFLLDLIQEGELRKAHIILMKIRGVGVKIASFYLRDVVYSANIKENKIKDAYLLQPIDIWVNRALHILNEKVPNETEEKQKLIQRLCNMARISGISFNQGCWFLGSQISNNEDHFRDLIISGESKRRSYLNEYLKKTTNGIFS